MKNNYNVTRIVFAFIIHNIISISSFAQTFSATTGGSIPDNGPVTCFPLSVSGVGTINGSYGLSTVCINITHTYDGDLNIYLKSPSGTNIPLSIQNGNSGNNYTNTCFTMNASNLISNGSAPFTGNYIPDGILGSFNNGQNANGIWNLCIQDVASGDIGVLNNFSITFNNNPATPIPLCGLNTLASNTCSTATPICNLNGYCGNTSSAYTINTWPQLTSAFCGTINNNSFIQFVASSSSVSLDILVYNSLYNDGIQMMIYSGGCGSGNVTSYGCIYQIVPSPLPTTFLANGLTPGNTYYLMIDGYGGDVCDYQISANSGINILSLTATLDTVCQGNTTTLTATGGNNSYTWSPSLTLNNSVGANVLASPQSTTTYTVTSGQIGSLNCPLTKSYTVYVKPVNIPTFDTIYPLCKGSSPFTLPTNSTNLIPISGTWSPAINMNTAGISTYTFTPSAGQCASSVTKNILINTLPNVVVNPAILNICNGFSDTLQASGALSYNWSPTGSTSSSIIVSPTSNSIYTVTGTDLNGCTNTSSSTININPVININSISNTSPTCVPGNDGSITITATGGTPTYQYNNGGANQISNIINNVGAGTYTVTVTDSKGCTVTSSIQIITPNGPVFSTPTIQNVNCHAGNNGSILQIASGGTGTINYNLQPTNQTNITGNFINLLANAYTVTATDGNGCSVTTQILVNQPNQLTFNNPTQINVSCHGGNNGSITQTAIGGTGLITYNIQPGNQTNTTGIFNNLVANNYTITATDVNNCSQTTTITITAPTQIVFNNPTITNVSCFGGNNGSITQTATGGSGIISYNIQPTNQSNTAGTFNNLAANNYIITATDVNGCSITTQLSITEPTQIQITNISNTAPSCVPGNDGSITITATGGTPTYQYNNGGANQISNIINNVGAGNYIVTVTDSKGCTTTGTTSLITPNSPNIVSVQKTSATCIPGNDATATITASSGTAPYTYSSNGITFQNSNLLTGLANTTYTIIVKDANGCTSSSVININAGVLPTISGLITTNILCNGNATGSIQTQISSGVGILTYQLLPNNVTNTTGVFSNLPASSYTITVTDVNGCSSVSSTTITQPQALQFTNVSFSGTICNGNSNGTINAPTIGGTGNITYSILPSANFVPPSSFNNLIGNITYTVTATDANNCSISTTIFISQPNAITINSFVVKNISCFNLNNGKLTVTASGGVGALTFSISPNVQINSTGIFNGLSAGNYTATIVDANGCSVTSTFNILNPAPIKLDTIFSSNVICNNQSNGKITISCSGGTGSLSYNLQPTNTTNTTGIFNNLPANTYTIICTDINACTYSTSVIINTPLPLIFDSIKTTNITCAGNANGSISAFASGGNGTIYTYSITPLNASNSTGLFNNLLANTYTVSATDSKGCSITQTRTITELLPLNFTLDSIKNIKCFGDNNGAIYCHASSGSPYYIYKLMPINITDSFGVFTNLPANTYSVVVTDYNGCSASINNITITQPNPLVINTFSKKDVLCNGTNTGEIKLIVTGGTGVINYTLSTNPTLSTSNGLFTNLYAGNYIVTAKDANGCSISTALVLNQNPVIEFSEITAANPLCHGDANGSIYVKAIGGTGTLTYQINNGPSLSNGNYLGLTGGNYLITVRDGNNCKKDTLFKIIEPASIYYSSLNISPVYCFGENNGSIKATASGGTGKYSYYIRPGLYINQNGSFYNLQAGIYTLTVIDENQCNFDTVVTISSSLSPLQTTMTKGDLGCYGKGVEGWANANISGGEPPYTVVWSTNPVQTTEKAENLMYGYYFVDILDANGCNIKDTVFIDPGTCCEEVFIPNAFTPNGDGVNDLFRVTTSAGIELIQFAIFDRWGNRIWNTYDFRRGWDGSYKGAQESMNTFHYIFHYKCLTDGNTYMRKGDVNLIR